MSYRVAVFTPPVTWHDGLTLRIDALRKALNQVSAALDARQFEKASSLGYGKVAEEFVFLQRTLGGLQGACLHKERLIQDLAIALHCPYEDVLPRSAPCWNPRAHSIASKA